MKKIALVGKMGNGLFAKVDDCYYVFLSTFRWTLFKAKRVQYAYTVINKKTWPMHRLIMGLTDHRQVVDHINYDGLDNRRKNLRVATHSTNMGHCKTKDIKTKSSKYKGVSWVKRAKRYRAHIRLNRYLHVLGYSTDPKECAKMYDAAAIEKFGQYALTNFKHQ
jgi:hypothetical protein